MVVTKGAALLALYDVAREFMSITSAKIDTREERERLGKLPRCFHIFFTTQARQASQARTTLFVHILANEHNGTVFFCFAQLWDHVLSKHYCILASGAYSIQNSKEEALELFAQLRS